MSRALRDGFFILDNMQQQFDKFCTRAQGELSHVDSCRINPHPRRSQKVPEVLGLKQWTTLGEVDQQEISKLKSLFEEQ